MNTLALNLQSLCKSFGTTQVLDRIMLQIPAGERWAIIGPNGAGKSVLLNVISGFSKASKGSVYLHGERIDSLPAQSICRLGLSRSFQTSSTFPTLTTSENLHCAVLGTSAYRYCFWRLLTRITTIAARVNEVLDQIGLTHRHDTPAGLLSYAEQRALEIGMTIAGNANTILLDEPTAGMSHAEAGAMVALLRRLTVGKTLLMVEHDMDVVFALADKIAVMVQGRLIACDTPDNIRKNPTVQNAYLGHASLTMANLT